MNGAAWLLAMATLGVDYGWRLDGNGQLEYIIQIPPSQLETLRDSTDGISSSIPPEVVRHVKRFRIVVGTDPLPKEPLPAFNDSQGVSEFTPLKLDASKVNPTGGEFNDYGGLVSPALESTVTPLDDLGSPRTLPGPARESPGDPLDAVGDLLPIPALPRLDHAREPLGSYGDSQLGATAPRRNLPRSHSEGSFQPNVSTPDIADTHVAEPRGPAVASVSPSRSALPPRRDLPTSWDVAGGYQQAPRDKSHVPLLLTVCALCLSIGGNVYLGWIAWGYYMKYRESFESWRNSWSNPG